MIWRRPIRLIPRAMLCKKINPTHLSTIRHWSRRLLPRAPFQSKPTRHCCNLGFWWARVSSDTKHVNSKNWPFCIFNQGRCGCFMRIPLPLVSHIWISLGGFEGKLGPQGWKKTDLWDQRSGCFGGNIQEIQIEEKSLTYCKINWEWKINIFSVFGYSLCFNKGRRSFLFPNWIFDIYETVLLEKENFLSPDNHVILTKGGIIDGSNIVIRTTFNSLY